VDYLEVKDWKEFQHYKDRDPTWIKLYRRLLADYAFSRLQDASKAHLVLIWLLASESEGRVPNDPEWIAKRIGATHPLDLNALTDAGFLLLESRKQSASNGRAKRLPRDRDRDRDRNTWLTPFGMPWQDRAGTPPFGQMARALKPLVEEYGEPEVLTRWLRYLGGTDPKFWSPSRFAATYKTWEHDPVIAGLTDETIQYVDE
jgi:hypothetical protein